MPFTPFISVLSKKAYIQKKNASKLIIKFSQNMLLIIFMPMAFATS